MCSPSPVYPGVGAATARVGDEAGEEGGSGAYAGGRLRDAAEARRAAAVGSAPIEKEEAAAGRAAALGIPPSGCTPRP